MLQKFCAYDFSDCTLLFEDNFEGGVYAALVFLSSLLRKEGVPGDEVVSKVNAVVRAMVEHESDFEGCATFPPKDKRVSFQDAVICIPRNGASAEVR